MVGSDRTPSGGARAVLVAGSSSVLGTLPAFLVGSLAIFVREDLRFDQAGLGVAVAAFFLASAAAAIPGGRITERVGARAAILAAAVGSGAALLGIALLARSWAALVGCLLLAGLANGVAQPAGNLALARGVDLRRQGFAFGLKQAAIPAATLLAGAAVPIVGLTVGWRWAFAGAAFGAVALAAIMPGDRYVSEGSRRGKDLRQGDSPILPLVVLAVAATCGAAVGTSLAAFFVESAVSSGLSPGPAGVLMVFGSTAAICARLAVGWLADRRERGHMVVVALLLASGAVGFAGLAAAPPTPLLLLATFLSFAAGWGWPGLFNYTVVRLNRNAPAVATAITQTGVFTGGVLGPAAFGALVERASFDLAWSVAAVVNVLGAGCVLLGRRLLQASAKAAPAAMAPARASEERP